MTLRARLARSRPVTWLRARLDRLRDRPDEAPAPPAPRPPIPVLVALGRTWRVQCGADGRWVVRCGLASEVRGTFAEKTEAVAFARAQARSDGGGLAVHRRDGSLQQRLEWPAAGSGAATPRAGGP